MKELYLKRINAWMDQVDCHTVHVVLILILLSIRRDWHNSLEMWRRRDTSRMNNMNNNIIHYQYHRIMSTKLINNNNNKEEKDPLCPHKAKAG